MPSDFHDKLINYMNEEGLHKHLIVGCLEAEINELQRKQEVVYLPELYKDFLRIMGKTTSRMLPLVSELQYQHLLTGKKVAQNILKADNIGLSLPVDAFVFLIHQGDAFSFFETKDRVEDPQVYTYQGESDQFEKTYEKLSACLFEMIDGPRHPERYLR